MEREAVSRSGSEDRTLLHIAGEHEDVMRAVVSDAHHKPEPSGTRIGKVAGAMSCLVSHEFESGGSEAVVAENRYLGYAYASSVGYM